MNKLEVINTSSARRKIPLGFVRDLRSAQEHLTTEDTPNMVTLGPLALLAMYRPHLFLVTSVAAMAIQENVVST